MAFARHQLSHDYGGSRASTDAEAILLKKPPQPNPFGPAQRDYGMDFVIVGELI